MLGLCQDPGTAPAAMSRLQAQRQRLYEPIASHSPTPPSSVRTLVLELSRPADWPAVGRLWQAVQEELGLPAPGIAINGLDGYQLWFSLASPIATDQAVAFLEGLSARYWADIPSERIRIMPALDGQGLNPLRHAGVIPPFTPKDGQWAAFVARDLAPVFEETPWLDIPPNPDGQADLLSALRSGEADMIPPLAELPAPAPQAPAASGTAKPSSGWASNTVHAQDPRQFLLQVMNDPSVDLALRIEAAKALLPQGSASSSGVG